VIFRRQEFDFLVRVLKVSGGRWLDFRGYRGNDAHEGMSGRYEQNEKSSTIEK
jgi:hypothetical protein